jgi:hypothetical protein
MLNELLKLLDFTEDEIARETPRFEKAFEICTIDDTDIERAIERLNTYFDMSSEGVRGIVATFLLAFNGYVLAREDGAEKIVYGEWPLPVQIMLAAKAAAPPNVLVGAPTQVLNVVLGQFFDKVTPLTEAGERMGQAAGNAHCALYQTFAGALELGILPKPDLLLSEGFFCEPPGAAMELLHTLYGIPVVHLDGNVDSPWGHWPKPWERQVKYLGHQIERMLAEIERIIGFKITEEDKRQGNRLNALLFYNHQKATQLVAQADPQPISHVGLALGGYLYNTPLPGDLQLRANDAISMLVDEVQEKVEKGEGVIEKGAPRVWFSIGVVTDPSQIYMVEKAGVNLTNLFYQFWLPHWMSPPTDYPTEYRGFGEKVAYAVQKAGPFCSVWGNLQIIKDYVDACKLDGMIYCHAYSCKGYTIPALVIKKEIEKDFGIPVMVMEGDIYDSRNYSAEQMRTRVETFAEMLREMKRAAS